MCMMVASRISHTFCARVVLRNLCYLSAGCNVHRSGRGSVWPVAEKGSRHAKPQMVESFGDKLRDQVYNYPRLYDLSLLLHSDKYDCQNSWWKISTRSRCGHLQKQMEKSPRPLCVCMAENARKTKWGRCWWRVLSTSHQTLEKQVYFCTYTAITHRFKLHKEHTCCLNFILWLALLFTARR